MITSNVVYRAPKSLRDAEEQFKSEGESSYFAGGTDIVPLMKYGVKRPSLLISLDRIDDLKKVQEDEDGIFIGSMVTLEDISTNILINKYLPSVSYSARCVASPQIRNIGTIGGNILQSRRCLYYNQSDDWRENITPCYKTGGDVCHQIPNSKACRAIYYSDLAPILLAYDTKIKVYENGEHKIVSLEDLVHSHINDERQKSIITGFIIPHHKDGSIGKFMKYSIRSSIDFPISNVGIRFTPKGEKGDRNSIKIYVGAVSPRPVELHKTEEFVLKNMDNSHILKNEIFDPAINELNSLCMLVRETTVSAKAKKKALLIIAEALTNFLEEL
jgi:CO/xanthine dehydrogenase FAD-binding subunit